MNAFNEVDGTSGDQLSCVSHASLARPLHTVPPVGCTSSAICSGETPPMFAVSRHENGVAPSTGIVSVVVLSAITPCASVVSCDARNVQGPVALNDTL